VKHAQETYGLSERHACRLLGQGRGTQRYEEVARSDEGALTKAVIALATKYGRYGYRRRRCCELRDGGLVRIACSGSGAGKG